MISSDPTSQHDGDTLGQRLRRARMERGLSMRALALSIGVTPSYLHYLEHDRRSPSRSVLRQLAVALGVGPQQLEYGNRAAFEADLLDAELELRCGSAAEAASRFAQLEARAQDAGDAQAASRARVGHGLARAELGQAEEAIASLEAAIAGGVGLRERPDVFQTLAHAHARLGDHMRAVEILQRALDEIRAAQPFDPPLFVRFATYLSYALSDLGDVAAAQRVVREALKEGEALPNDHLGRIRLAWAVGRAQSVNGEHELAVHSLRRAIALLEQGEDLLTLGQAHELTATTLLDAGEWREAEAHLEQALALVAGSRFEAGSRAELARLHVAAGRHDDARAEAARTLRLLEGVDDQPDALSAAWRTLAAVHERLGEIDLAEQCHRFARERLAAASRKDRLESLAAYGDFLERQGRALEALAVMREVAELAGVRPAGGRARSDGEQR